MTLLQERLFAMQDKQYAAFQAKLTPGVPVESFIGYRMLYHGMVARNRKCYAYGRMRA